MESGAPFVRSEVLDRTRQTLYADNWATLMLLPLVVSVCELLVAMSLRSLRNMVYISDMQVHVPELLYVQTWQFISANLATVITVWCIQCKSCSVLYDWNLLQF